jgi:rhodanese-related sulfurtransferase
MRQMDQSPCPRIPPASFDNGRFLAILILNMRNVIYALMVALGTFAAAAADAFPSISTADLNKAISEKKVVLLDVNGTQSWRNGHIPEALDFEAAETKLAEKLPADKNALIVAYCGNEKCQAYRAGAQAAKELGYTNVKHYSKGIQGWVAENQPVEKAR